MSSLPKNILILNYFFVGNNRAYKIQVTPPFQNGSAKNVRWIFRLNQTTNTKLLIGLEYAEGSYDDRGVGLRYNTTAGYGDTNFMFEGEYGNGGGAVSSGIAADTNWHHLKLFWVSANKMGMSLDGGSTVTLCTSGCTITNGWSGGGWPFGAAVYCGSGTVAAQTTVDLDYFGFVATVGSR